jgi:carboxypeptidase Taq
MDLDKHTQKLVDHLSAAADLDSAAAVLHWDQQTYMPPGGVAARAEALATLSRLSHGITASDETARLLDAAGDPEPGSDAEAVIRVARRNHERATKLPSRLVADISRATTLAEPAWRRSRAEADFGSLVGHLQEILDLQRAAAEHLGYEDHPYDALLDRYEPGATKARLESMFGDLKKGTAGMVRAVTAAADDRTAPIRGTFDEAGQEAFGKKIAAAFGYDWGRGRQDRAPHPFCINFGGPGDVRITTRFDPGRLSPALFATMHEAGHALYEQGVDPAYTRTPLSGGVSLGIHESQSRLYENVVGRSRPFWSHFYPRLQDAFPDAFGGTSEGDFYRAINAASPSEIRVEADELTYNLHVVLRFELEVALVEGSLAVPDLPEAWDAKMEEHLGISPADDARGVLQDDHWAIGYFGYFPTYTLGNVLSVQLFEAALKAHPEIPAEMERGEFGALLAWLRENVHRHGKKHDPEALIEHATGRPPETGPYVRYLEEKFGELYGF